MFAYILRSLLQGAVVLIAVAFIAFSMFRFVGDPVANMVGQEASMADREELTKHLGLDQPFPIQFLRFLGKAAQGDFGISYRQGRPVAAVMAERLPATVELAVLSAIFATVVGVALGVYAAIRRHGLVANAVMTLSLVGVSLPTFLIGIGLIYVFAVELRWLPSFGRGETVRLGWWTTGLLTKSGPAVADPASADARILPAYADHAARAVGDARGDALGFHPLRPSPRHPEPRHRVPPCPAQHHDPGRHHRRAAARLGDRFCHRHRSGSGSRPKASRTSTTSTPR